MTLRVAVLSDIHANPFALEAVIDDIARQKVDEVIVGGDLVGRGPLGSRVVARIQDLGWVGVRGNHEDYTLNFRRENVHATWLTAREWAASRWMAAELSPEHVEYLDTLPFTRAASVAPSLRVFHGSPDSYREGLGDWTDNDIIERHINGIEETLLVCGHTHRPMVRETPGGLVVNVGSVGLPFNGDPRAQYAIFTQKNGHWQVELRQVDYDRDAFLREYITSGFMDAAGVTAHLLTHEIRHARPFLVPFIEWSAATGRKPADMDALPEFLEVFRPEMSKRDFIKMISAR